MQLLLLIPELFRGPLNAILLYTLSGQVPYWRLAQARNQSPRQTENLMRVQACLHAAAANSRPGGNTSAHQQLWKHTHI